MADNRTGLSPADIAESFRDRCGDGSVEWVYTPTQTRVLLDAADMLDENANLVMKLNAEHLVRQNMERENAKLRELVQDMWNEGMCECGSRGKCARCEYGYPDRMRELGVDE